MLALGDLAQGLMLRHRIGEIKATIEARSTEVSTGLAVDAAAHLGGDTSIVASLERSLSNLSAYKVVTAQTEQVADTMQSAMETIQEASSDAATTLIGAELNRSPEAMSAMGQTAMAALTTTVLSLQTSVMGNSVFAGTATNRAATQGIDVLLDEVRTAFAGLGSLSDIRAAADAWFDTAGGGFETTFYTGSTDYLAPVKLGDSEAAQLALKADDPVFRKVIKELAIAAVTTDPSLAMSDQLRTALLKSAGENLVAVQGQITDTRAQLGTLQEQIENVQTKNASSRTSIELALSSLLGVDEYDAATRLQEAQFQLESLYAITARSSRLNLVNYLR